MSRSLIGAQAGNFTSIRLLRGLQGALVTTAGPQECGHMHQAVGHGVPAVRLACRNSSGSRDDGGRSSEEGLAKVTMVAALLRILPQPLILG